MIIKKDKKYISITFKDSLLLLPGSLTSLCKSFEIEEKNSKKIFEIILLLLLLKVKI